MGHRLRLQASQEGKPSAGLAGEPELREAGVAIGVILLAFPGLWWWLHRAGGVAFVVCFLGGISGASMFLVGAAWGLTHLAGYSLSVSCSEMKASTATTFDGVWDRELDRNLPAEKL
jgi:hypothetical protein